MGSCGASPPSPPAPCSGITRGNWEGCGTRGQRSGVSHHAPPPPLLSPASAPLQLDPAPPHPTVGGTCWAAPRSCAEESPLPGVLRLQGWGELPPSTCPAKHQPPPLSPPSVPPLCPPLRNKAVCMTRVPAVCAILPVGTCRVCSGNWWRSLCPRHRAGDRAPSTGGGPHPPPPLHPGGSVREPELLRGWRIHEFGGVEGWGEDNSVWRCWGPSKGFYLINCKINNKINSS